MKVLMIERIKCKHCNKLLAGEGHLRRHVRTIHKSKLSVKNKN